MARYVVHVHSPMSPTDCFDYMADLSNFAEWDPGVAKVEQVEGDGGGPDAAFDVSIKSIAGSLKLRYRTVEYDPPNSVVARAKNHLVTSLDTITVVANGDGSTVTYDAKLTLNGLLALADPLLRCGFNRIGDRAAQGLIQALEGERMAVHSS